MIQYAEHHHSDQLRKLWNEHFNNVSKLKLDYYFKCCFEPKEILIGLKGEEIVSSIKRSTLELMFNHRIIKSSYVNRLVIKDADLGVKLLDNLSDILSNQELISLAYKDQLDLWQDYEFKPIYYHNKYVLLPDHLPQIDTKGCYTTVNSTDLLYLYAEFVKRFDGFQIRDLNYFDQMKQEVKNRLGKIIGYQNEEGKLLAYAVLLPYKNYVKVEELIYLDSTSMYKVLNVAMKYLNKVLVEVSEQEDLSIFFPQAKCSKIPYLYARINDYELFNKLYQTNVTSVFEAFALSGKLPYFNNLD